MCWWDEIFIFFPWFGQPLYVEIYIDFELGSTGQGVSGKEMTLASGIAPILSD
jgi:hypothetical protein